jgi:hypothetical protein
LLRLKKEPKLLPRFIRAIIALRKRDNDMAGIVSKWLILGSIFFLIGCSDNSATVPDCVSAGEGDSAVVCGDYMFYGY